MILLTLGLSVLELALLSSHKLWVGCRLGSKEFPPMCDLRPPLTGVLSYRIMEPRTIEPLWRAARITRLLLRFLGGKTSLVVNQELHLAPICTIEPLWRSARNTRLLLRALGGKPSLVVNQERHPCPNSTPVAPAVGSVATLVVLD